MGFKRATISSPCYAMDPLSKWNIFGRILKYIGQNLNDYGRNCRILEDFGSVDISRISVEMLIISHGISRILVRILKTLVQTL